MRRHRAANREKRLRAGVDLPVDAGTCGCLVWPAHERCYACHLRRQWLLNHALNPTELTLAALLESVEDDAAMPDAGPSEDAGQAVPLLDDRSTLGDPCPTKKLPVGTGSCGLHLHDHSEVL